MPFYKTVFDGFKATGDDVSSKRAARALLDLRTQLRRELPQRNVTDSILLATWNLREFGANSKFGKRLDESLLYIAEIVSHFDLIAIQEVNQNLGDLKLLMQYLGRWWEYLVTDVTPGHSGNMERMAFVYDGRKVQFDHLAGEVSLADGPKQQRQPARSPFICAFRTGWRRVSLCSVHIYYGKAAANDKRRVTEIDTISELLAKRNASRQNVADGEPENVVLLGDFNIFNREGDKTSSALEKHDFIVPKSIRRAPGSNIAQDKYFDQIAFHDPKGRLKTTSKAGVFQFTKSVFKDGDAGVYSNAMQAAIPAQFKRAKDPKALYKKWRTFQISDHYPLWLELKTDFANAYLATIAGLNRKKK